MPEDLLNDNNALGFLREEHQRIQELLATCLNSEQPDFTRQVTNPLLDEIAVHNTMEHDFFFPYIKERMECSDRAYPEEAQRSIDDSLIVEELAERLANLDPVSREFDTTLLELARAFQHHCYMEEQYMFLLVEMSTPRVRNDLVRLAQEMALERQRMLKEPTRRVPKLASAQAREERREARLEDTRDQEVTDVPRRDEDELPPRSH